MTDTEIEEECEVLSDISVNQSDDDIDFLPKHLNAAYFPYPLLERVMREIVLVPAEDYGKTRSRLWLIFIEILLLEISNIKGKESAKSAFSR